MKYRIVREETSNDNIRYIIERKDFIFWHSVRHMGFDYVLDFDTVQEAEEYARKLIRWNTPISVTRTIIKEIK